MERVTTKFATADLDKTGRITVTQFARTFLRNSSRRSLKAGTETPPLSSTHSNSRANSTTNLQRRANSFDHRNQYNNDMMINENHSLTNDVQLFTAVKTHDG
jgi:hypothetical protein